MRYSRRRSATLLLSVLLAAMAAGQLAAQVTPPASQPAPPLGPYKPVPITLPTPIADPSFDAFRKQLAEIAQKKDRAALAELVAAGFFWMPADSDLADKSKSPIDNLAKAIGLDGANATGWDTLAAYAAEPSTMPDSQRDNVFCAPAEAAFDDNAADELATATQTDASDWVFPVRDDIEVRADAKRDAEVIDKLGLYLVRVLPDDSPLNAVLAAFVKVLTPSGKIGFVAAETVLPIGGEKLCYLKEETGWKIAGFLGGEPSP